VTDKADINMNNDNLSKKRILVVATMLSAVMLAASSIPSLVPTGAFALDMKDIASEASRGVDALTQDVYSGSNEDESETSSSDESETSSSDESATTTEATTEANPSDSEVNVDTASEEDASRAHEDDFVNVEPISQVDVASDVNVNVDANVVMDEEDCDEASNEVTQGNIQGSNQQASSDGNVGENSFYVSPKSQVTAQSAFNANVDVDAVLVDGCNPVDDVSQTNVQTSNQEVGGDVEATPSSTVLIPADQRAYKYQENYGLNSDIVL
jgi:hypothetical protein